MVAPRWKASPGLSLMRESQTRAAMLLAETIRSALNLQRPPRLYVAEDMRDLTLTVDVILSANQAISIEGVRVVDDFLRVIADVVTYLHSPYPYHHRINWHTCLDTYAYLRAE